MDPAAAAEGRGRARGRRIDRLLLSLSFVPERIKGSSREPNPTSHRTKLNREPSLKLNSEQKPKEMVAEAQAQGCRRSSLKQDIASPLAFPTSSAAHRTYLLIELAAASTSTLKHSKFGALERRRSVSLKQCLSSSEPSRFMVLNAPKPR